MTLAYILQNLLLLFPVQTVWLMVSGRSEGDYGRGLEDAEGDAEEAAVDT